MVAFGMFLGEYAFDPSRLPYKNKIFYNLVSHNRVIGMSVDDFFYATEAKKSDIYEGLSHFQIGLSIKNISLKFQNGPRHNSLPS